MTNSIQPVETPVWKVIDREKIGPLLIILLIFFLPISTTLTSIFANLIIGFWLLTGEYGKKLRVAAGNPISIAVLAYIGFHLLALLWTTDLGWGLHMIKKQWKLLLLPIALPFILKEHVKYYVGTFVCAMAFCVLLSYCIWMNWISIAGASPNDPTPFVNHIDYSPFLAFAIYILLYTIFLKGIAPPYRYLLMFLAIMMTANLFITLGRTGQIAFFALVSLFAFQYLGDNFKKAFVLSTVLIFSVFLTAYEFSPFFSENVNATISQAKSFREKPGTSVGERLTFIANTATLIASNPLFGVGTGDFPAEYRQINEKISPAFPATTDPHNQYLLAMSQFGIAGFAVFASIFFFLLKNASQSGNPISPLRTAFATLYMVIMLGGSYLMHHNAALLFAIFGAVLYREVSCLPTFTSVASGHHQHSAENAS